MKTYFTKIKTWASAHKFLAGIVLLIIAYTTYWGYGKLTSTAGETKYTTSVAEKGTLVSSISGSGQVSAVSQVDMKAKVSGDVIYVGVKNSQKVKAGTLLLQLDASVAEKSVRDAEVSLESAQLSLQKLKQPADELTITQSQNSLDRARTSKQNALDNLAKTYDDNFNSVSNSFLDLPGIVSGLHDLMYTTSAVLGGVNMQNVDYYTSNANNFDARGAQFGSDAQAKYQVALTKYNKNFQDYKSTDRSAEKVTLEALVSQTYDTTLAVSEAVKSLNNLIQFYKDQMTQHSQVIPSLANTHLTTLNTYTGNANAHLGDLLTLGSGIKSDKNTILAAEMTITETTQSLAKLKAGADALDIQSSALSLKQRENALFDAREKLAEYYIRAPFDGTVAKVNYKKTDSVSSGATALTFVTEQKLATIALNEVDVARVKIGQKVTLTFDAVEGLSISGEVVDVDTVGTVTQGVVNYTVTINFDTQDDRVKPGMSVSASIITNVKTDVILVPNSAVKSRGTNSYVEMFDVAPAGSDTAQGGVSKIPPKQIDVEIGLSNDIATEIISGLGVDDKVVTKTTSGTPVTAAAPSLFGGGGRIGR